jgi:hypothetical protein
VAKRATEAAGVAAAAMVSTEMVKVADTVLVATKSTYTMAAAASDETTATAIVAKQSKKQREKTPRHCVFLTFLPVVLPRSCSS